MPRPPYRPKPPLVLPAEPDPDKMPVRNADRRQLREIHERYYGPISERTFERWPLQWRIVNGRAVSGVREFLAEAERRFNEALVIRGGRNPSPPNAPHEHAAA